jgi:hypothetical protein
MTDKIKNTFDIKKSSIDVVCVEKLIASAKTDVSGKWISKDELKEYTDRVISMCIVAAVNTSPHAATTHDHSIATGTIQKVIENIKRSFGRA